MRATFIATILLFTALEAFPQNMTFKLSGTDAHPVLEHDYTGGASIDASKPSALSFTCAGNVDCTKITATYAGSAVDVSGDAQSASGTLIIKAGTNDLVIAYGGQPFTPPIKVMVAAGTASPSSTETKDTSQAVPISELLRLPCAVSVSDVAGDDIAQFVVSPLGAVLSAPAEPVETDDKVIVTVAADTRLLPLLNVKRKSAVRAVGTVNVIGAGVTVSLPAASAQATHTPTCGHTQFELTDFASGTGEIGVFAYSDQGQTELGSFNFAVEPLYDGIFSFGPAKSSVTDQTYSLVPKDDKKVIAPDLTDDELTYAVLYTPFVWAKRNPERATPHVWEHINPTLGIAVQQTASNAFAGVSLDWKGFLFTAGTHYRRVKRLGGHLKEGDVFTGAAADIPTVKRWEHSSFYAVTIDLRVAAQLLRTIATTATQ